MSFNFRALSAMVCLTGLAACEKTPAHSADDHYVATSSTTAAGDPVMTPASSDAAAAPAADTRDGALVAPENGVKLDNKAAAPGTATNTTTEAKPSAPSPALAPPPAGTAPDNTKVNKRDTDKSALTPMDQGNGDTDLKITQKIRQAVMSDGSLSFTAKNVKIITVNGKVTLRGPVNTEQERSAIAAAAAKVAGAQVDNQLEVKK